MNFLQTAKGKRRKLRLLLIPVFSVFVCVFAYLSLTLLKKQDKQGGFSVREEGGSAEQERFERDSLGEMRSDGLRRVSGFVGEISQGQKPDEQVIKLRVPKTLDQNPSKQSGENAASEEYLFSVLEKEMRNIREKRLITVYFHGEPSENFPVPVEKVRLGGGG